LVILLAFLPVSSLFSQRSCLSKKISVNLPSCSMDEALKEISAKAGFRFSYDASLVAGSRPVRVRADNLPVNEILKNLLGKDLRPREIGSHVILVRDRADSREKQPSPAFPVTGTVLDAGSKTPLENVTVYEAGNSKSAITAKKGTFRIVIPAGGKIRGITFCKRGYTDTVVFIRQGTDRQINVLLGRQEGISRLRMMGRSVVARVPDSMKLITWLVPKLTRIHAQNLEVRTARTFQASIIPYVGTNWKVTGSVTNRFSVNLLAGYTGGLKGLELGGLLNITRNSMEGLQLCGLANVVTGRMKGFQAACVANVVTNNCDGWQVSGFVNAVAKDVNQVQISGLVNYGNDLSGLQLAGLINIARHENSGAQIAAFLNCATTVNGLQLAAVNVCNEVIRGTPIGFFSYVQRGYHLFELSGNEIFYGNVAFKSGTRSFYNFAQIGMGSGYKLHLSYGIGTIFTLKKKLSMNIDASLGFVYHPTDTVYHGMLLKFNPALEYRVAGHFAIFAGPAYNYFLFSKGKPSATPRGLSTYDFYFRSTEHASIQMWIGGVAGVRF